MKNILITGCHGQLGKAINCYYKDNNNVKLINTDVAEMNITDLPGVLKKVAEVNPDIIINCAAHTGVDACETEEERAYQINAIGAKNLSIAATENNAVMVHISSDYVFDGTKQSPYNETDEFNPQTIYGKTKLAGEEFVIKYAKQYFIIRTAWLFGDGKNFVRTMLNIARTKKEVNIVCDQYGTPTSAEEVTKVIDLLINTDKYGVYHATCEGSCSWADFAKEIFRINKLDVKVIPVTTLEYPAVAKRPLYSVLENVKLKKEFGYTMCEWHKAIEKYLIDESKKEREN